MGNRSASGLEKVNLHSFCTLFLVWLLCQGGFTALVDNKGKYLYEMLIWGKDECNALTNLYEM